MTGAVDASIPLQAGKGVQQTNPLQTISSFADAMNKINENRLFPGRQQLQSQAIQSGQTSLGQQVNQAAWNFMLPALTEDPSKITPSYLTDMMGRGEHGGLVMQPVVQFLASHPELAGDGVAMQNALRQQAVPYTLKDTGQAVQSVTGERGVQTDNQTIQPGTYAPASAPNFGQFTPQGAATQIQPSPETLMQPRDIVVTPEYARTNGMDPSTVGTTIRGPVGTASPYRGTEGAPTGGGLAAPPAGAPVVPLQNGYGPSGADGIPMNPPLRAGFTRGPDGKYYPTQPAAPGGFVTRPGHVLGQLPVPAAAAAAAPAAGPAGGAPQGFLPTGMPTGVAENIGQNQTAFRNAQTAAAQMPINNTQFMEAHDAISRLQNATAGTGAFQGAVNDARRVLLNLGAGSMAANVNDAATAEKYLGAAIAAKSGRSDAQQALQEASNPTLKTPAGASLPMIRQIVANNRALQATVQSADQSGTGYLSHATTQSQLLNSKEGLTALSWDMMPPAARTSFLTSIKGNAAATSRFENALRMGHNMQLITPPGGAPGG
jgi:hypothetical protein